MMKHDIEFKRHGTKVQLAIDTDLPYDEENNTILYFYHECPDMKHAELLRRYLKMQHADAISAIRKAEYNDGWKTTKGKKRRKSDSFSYRMFQKAMNWSM